MNEVRDIDAALARLSNVEGNPDYFMETAYWENSLGSPDSARDDVDILLAFLGVLGGEFARLTGERDDWKAAHIRSHDKAVERCAEIARLREALEDFVKWSEAYPNDVFVEPDYEKAHTLLQAGGMTLDALSAATLRLATREMGKRARAALGSPDHSLKK